MAAARFCQTRSGGRRSLLRTSSVPGAAVVAGADDQRHGRRGLRLAEQLGRQDQQTPVLRAQAEREPQLNLGRLNDAQFENLPMLQAFKWSPVKILAFLLSNSKSRFAIHLQLREFMYERVEHWDIYISLSAFQGHTRYSDIASDESFGKKLSMSDLMSLGKVFHCTTASCLAACTAASAWLFRSSSKACLSASSCPSEHGWPVSSPFAQPRWAVGSLWLWPPESLLPVPRPGFVPMRAAEWLHPFSALS